MIPAISKMFFKVSMFVWIADLTASAGQHGGINCTDGSLGLEA
jgi:hypothetical protein